MSATETADAVLIVIKRLAKWALWVVLGLVLLASIFWAGLQVKEYLEDRPYQAKRYADLSLGDQQREVLYAFGPPTQYLMPPPPAVPGKPAPAFQPGAKIVWDVGQSDASKETYRDSTEWLYAQDRKRLEVHFDKPGGQVAGIACYSSGIFECPALYGIRDGSREEDVLTHLGRPASEQVDGLTKTMRYPQYNLTLYLEKRRVYMIQLSAQTSF